MAKIHSSPWQRITRIGTSAWAGLGQQIKPAFLSVTVLGQGDRAICRLLQLHMCGAMGTISAFPPVLILSLLQSWHSPEVFSAIIPGAETQLLLHWDPSMWEVSAQSSQNKTGYSLFDLINLIDLLPSSVPAEWKYDRDCGRAAAPCYWQLHCQSQLAARWKGVVVLSAGHLLPLQNQVKLVTSQTQNLIPDSGTACHNTSFHSEMKMLYLPYMALHALLKVNKIELVTPGWEFPYKCTVGCNQLPLLITSSAAWTTREKKIQKTPWKSQASTNEFQFPKGNSLHCSLVSVPISDIKIRHEWQNQN